jgi:hypothetical protein
MTREPDQPLRGEAAWIASKAEIAQRNDAARARGSKLRESREAERLVSRRAADAREREHRPEQPRP